MAPFCCVHDYKLEGYKLNDPTRLCRWHESEVSYGMSLHKTGPW